MEIYNKLVRDKIPEIITKNNEKPITRILDDKEYLEELNKKLIEEVNEYTQSGDILEIADIEEVIKAIIKIKGYNQEEFEKMRIDKVNKRGAFDEKIFLEKVE